MRKKQETLVLTEEKGKYSDKISAIARAAGAMGIAVGITGIFFTLGGAPVFPAPVLASVIMVAVISVLDLITKGRSYGIILCLLLAASLFFGSVSAVIRGIYGWSNYFRNAWNTAFDTFYAVFPVSGYTESDLLITGMILALVGVAAVWELMRRKAFVLLSLIVCLPLCLCLILSIRLPVWVAAVLMAGWIMAWCRMSGPDSFRWEAVILAVGTGIILYVLPGVNTGMQWQKASAEFRIHIKEEIERVRFGRDSLPEGDLTKADRMLTGTKDTIRLEMEEAAPLYLRGFVGTSYEKNEWKHFTAQAYGGEFSGMLSWLAGQAFFPGAQYADYLSVALEESGSKEERTLSVSVRNLGADRRYLYLPETAVIPSRIAGGWKQDWSMEAKGWFGQRRYEFAYYDAQSGGEVQMPDAFVYRTGEDSERAERFRQAENVYRSFVYENYLEIDEEQRELIDAVFFQGDSWEKTEGLYTVTSRIRAVLRILTDYKEVPVQVPKNRDFLSWFLQEGKEGNAAYYASTAVLAYRAAGIPARYVEGYFLSKEEAESGIGGPITLSGKNAHAWVEVYIDGMGWRTIEVTPGFYEELYQADIVVAVPNEDLEGANGNMEGIPISEEYEPPEQETGEDIPAQNRNTGWILLLFAVLAILLLVEVVHLIRILYVNFRYRRMTKQEQMYFLYGRIMGMMRKLYHDFNPEHPLELPVKEKVPFDAALYERTIERMEKMIYGQIEPASREIPAAEALDRQMRAALNRKMGWRWWISGRFSSYLPL